MGYSGKILNPEAKKYIASEKAVKRSEAKKAKAVLAEGISQMFEQLGNKSKAAAK